MDIRTILNPQDPEEQQMLNGERQIPVQHEKLSDEDQKLLDLMLTLPRTPPETRDSSCAQHAEPISTKEAQQVFGMDTRIQEDESSELSDQDQDQDQEVFDRALAGEEAETGSAIKYPRYAQGASDHRLRAQAIIRENNASERACLPCQERGQICYRSRRPDQRRCAFCVSNTRMRAKDCVVSQDGEYTGPELSGFPDWAVGTTVRRLEAQAVISKNNVSKVPCGPCREAGVTCYRNLDGATTKCAYCRTMPGTTRVACLGLSAG